MPPGTTDWCPTHHDHSPRLASIAAPASRAPIGQQVFDLGQGTVCTASCTEAQPTLCPQVSRPPGDANAVTRAAAYLAQGRDALRAVGDRRFESGQSTPGPASVSIAALVLATLTGFCARADVVVSGVSDEQKRNILHGLTLARAPCDTPAWSLRRQTGLAQQQVAAALEPLGYYRASASVADVEARGDCWRKRIDVVPGEPARYVDVDVRVTGPGRDDAAFAQVLARRAPHLDDVVHHGRYETLKSSLSNTAIQFGYFDAGFAASRVDISEDGATGSAEVIFDTGPRYRFGDIVVDSDLIEARLFDALIDIQAQTPYTATAVAATHRNLLESGYFAYVTVRANPADAEDLAIPVRIEAAPAKTRVYTGGLGFATDVGPRFRLNYRNRRINRRGHTLNSQLLASPVQSLLGVEYRIPAGDDRRDVFSLASTIEEQDTDTSEFASLELGLRRTQARDSGWLRTLGLDLRREDFKVGTENDISTLLIPSVGWWRSTQNASARPDHGYRVSFDLRGAGDTLGSNSTFVQVEANARVIRSLGERVRVLGRLSLGATLAESGDPLPVSLRFFAGGDNSVRGYGFETLGPLDADGIVTGGNRLVAGSLEFDYRIGERWAVAVFADSGAAFDEGDATFSTGLGIGVRRLTPVGPVRVDLATPLDLDRSVRLHFSIGSDL